jgi:pyruvate kinase
LSHGNAENNLKFIENIRKASSNVTQRTRYYQPLAIALDLRGPEMRIARIGENFNRMMTEGESGFKFSCDPKYDEIPPVDLAYVPYNLIGKFLKKGKILSYWKSFETSFRRP